MPELPEVETVKRGLQTFLPGKIFATVVCDNLKSFPNASSDVDAFLISSSVVKVTRRAKVLTIQLSSNYSLVIHLKMTGQLVFVGPAIIGDEKNSTPLRFGAGHPNASLIQALPDRSTRVTFKFIDGSHLHFNDQRKFGWVRLMPTSEIPHMDFFKKLGPEPLEDSFTWHVFAERLARRKNTTIKAALLDQTVLAGVGNIYADESLWGARIHPSTIVRGISKAKIKSLHASLQSVLRRSIALGGSTDRNYVDATGKKGSYLLFAEVFRKEGSACSRCGHQIIKLRVAGRGTHICPFCQRLVRTLS